MHRSPLRPARSRAQGCQTMKKLLLDASRISDFRIGTDKVIRRGTRCFIVSGGPDYRNSTASYADLEVKSDVLTDALRENFSKLTSEQRDKMRDAVWHSPYLSDEGRQ